MNVTVEQRHLDSGIRIGTACPMALAIKDELDKSTVPKGYLRVDRVVSVSSSVWVTEHRVAKRKGREEIDLAFEHYWLGKPVMVKKDDDLIEMVNIYAAEIDYMVAFDEGQKVGPKVIEITKASESKDAA